MPRALPPELLELTYQNRLRSIGRHLDLHDRRSVVILEVDGGFVVRCVSRVERDIELIEFTDVTYPDRMIEATESRGQGERIESPSPIAPTGYEDLLRAVGRLIDTMPGSGIVIGEKEGSLLVSGDDMSGPKPAPFAIDLTQAAITELLDESFRLRFRNGQPEGRG